MGDEAGTGGSGAVMWAMDPPLQERVYAGLKADYLAGHFVPGKRIDIQNLADRHRSSKTPVREAAFILVGEGLLSHHNDGGFIVPILAPADLIELLAWHLQLMIATLSTLKESALRTALQKCSSTSENPSAVSVATRAADIFTSMAEATGNRLASAQIRRLNERLHYSRIIEATNPALASKELDLIIGTDVKNVHKATRRRIEAYHLRKISHLREIIQEASRSVD